MHKPAGNIRALLLGLVLATAVALVWISACAVLANLIEARQRTARLRQSSYQEFVVLQDGTPVIATTSYADYSVLRTFHTLDGKPRETGSELRTAHLLPPPMLGRYAPRPHWPTRVQGCSDFHTPPSFWYFVHDGQRQGQASFEGYDSVTRQRTGWIGRRGFREEVPEPEDRFSVDGRALPTALVGLVPPGTQPWGAPTAVGAAATGGPIPSQIPLWRVYLISAGQLLEIDLRTRQVRAVLENAEIVSAGIAEQALGGEVPGAHSGAPGQYLAARDRDAVWIVDPSQGTSREFLLPEDLRERYLGVYLLRDGLLLTAKPLYSFAPMDVGVRAGAMDVVRLDEQGEITRRVSLDLPGHRRESTWVNRVGAAIMLPVPALMGLVLLVFAPWQALMWGDAGSYADAVGTSLREYGWSALAVTLVAIALAAWCYRRHRRYGQSGGWLWFAFVLLLGLPGLAGYLLHRRWPVRLACPSCGQRAPRDRLACYNCGAEFPRPAATGTEVFG